MPMFTHLPNQKSHFFLEQRKAGLNLQFSNCQFCCLTKAKEPSLPYYFSITGRRDGFMTFLRTLVWSVTQTASSRIWTQVSDSISYDNNCYTNSMNYTKVCIYLIDPSATGRMPQNVHFKAVGLVWFYGISTIVIQYQIVYIKYIYDL